MTVEVVCACGQREVPQSDAVMLIWSHGADNVWHSTEECDARPVACACGAEQLPDHTRTVTAECMWTDGEIVHGFERCVIERRELEAELAAVKAQLKGAPAVKAAPAKVDWKAVRAWAQANGYDVPKVGRIGQGIVDAYDQAHR